LKKLIRVFIIVFCLFFAFMAIPDSILPVISHYTREYPKIMGNATLRLAEKIDSLMDRDGSGGGENAPPESGSTRGSASAGEPDAAEDLSTDSGQVHEEKKPASDDPETAESSETAEAGSENTNDQAAVSEEDTQQDIFYYYYTKISREERLIYDAMLALAQSYDAASPSTESRLLDMDPSSDEFAESYTRAYNALVRDHPELFWIAQMKAQFECKYYLLPSFGGKYKVVLSLMDATGEDTGGENGRSIYLDQQARLEQSADAILEKVDFTQSDAGIALQIHDLLIDSAWYDTDADEYDYAHTAYGALVEDSRGNSGGALCDGYSLAYEYLLQRAGINCIVVSGYAGPSAEETEKHAWNLVQLDEEWYEVDATWDDLDFALSPSEDGYDLFLEAISDEDYISRIRHYMFNLTTDQMSSFTPGDEFTYYSDNGWVTLLQPSVHIRSTSEESEVTRDYVTPLAPRAEGTWYTWAMLTGHE